MEETLKIVDKEKEFYDKKFYLSYSGLSKLLYSPSLFYKHYILQEREERLDTHLIDGKVIHCLLLDNGSFDKQFIISPASLPTGNTKLVIDKVVEYKNTLPDLDNSTPLSNFGDKIIEILKEINLHQSLKTDAQRLDKILTEEAKSYYEFLKVKGSKDIIDTETLNRCNEAVAAIQSDSKCCELLGLIKHETENIDVFNEILLTRELDEYKFGIRGILDNVKIDYNKKILYINDLKTTGKTIVEFKDTVDYYNYWAQMVIYNLLVLDGFKDLIKENWEIIHHFIVIDKYNQVYPFRVSTETLNLWQVQFQKKLEEFNWHYTEKKYNLPYEFAISKVIL